MLIAYYQRCTAAEAEIYPDRELAINPGQVFGELAGTPTKDPDFRSGCRLDRSRTEGPCPDAWLYGGGCQYRGRHPSERDPPAPRRTNSSVIRRPATARSPGKDRAQAGRGSGAQDPVSGRAAKILQNLLEEHVPIRDIRTIAETLAEQAPRSQDPGVLTAAVRVALSRGIVQQLIGSYEEIPVAVLDPGLEQILHQTLQTSDESIPGLSRGWRRGCNRRWRRPAANMEQEGQESVLLVAAPIRPWMARFAKHAAPGMHVLSYNEIPDNRQIRVISTIGNTHPETRPEG